jgi:hypothetical protein
MTAVTNAVLLAGGKVRLACTRVGPDLVLEVPAAAPNAVDTVIALDCDGEPRADADRLLAANIPVDTLRSFDAKLEGKLQFGPGKTRDAWVSNWKSRQDAVVWPVRLNERSAFDVSIVYDAPPDTKGNLVVEKDAGKEAVGGGKGAGGLCRVKIGDQVLEKKVRVGFQVKESLGRVTLPPGRFEIRVSAGEISGQELMRLRAVTLTPVRD